MTSIDRKTSFGKSFRIGFLLAPASGLLLFVVAFLIVHIAQYGGLETGNSQGLFLSLVVLMTIGL